MIGAIAGDIIGSVFEWSEKKPTAFPLFSPQSRFTDDTVLSVAVAESILDGAGYAAKLGEFYAHYPDVGYGRRFTEWALAGDKKPYNSWGNGSAMRVGPIGFAFESLDRVLSEARQSAEVTHNHPEGIKGAQAIAAAVFLAKNNESKHSIKTYIEKSFGYDLGDSIDNLRETYTFDVSCQGSVPQAIIAFLESTGFEDGIRKAISIGGDSDTIGCMSGAILQAYYKSIPLEIVSKVHELLDFRLSKIVVKFSRTYGLEME